MTRYRQRDENARQAFAETLSQYNEEQLVWVDECGINQELYRLYGRSERGQRVYADISGKRIVPRISLIGAYCNGKLCAPFRFGGYTDTRAFNLWVEKCLLAELHEGQVVILDNASFHQSSKTRQLIESAKCQLIFQPAYSPDLNKMEPQWAHLKLGVRANQNPELSLHQKIDLQLIKMSDP